MPRYICEVYGQNKAGADCARWFAVEAEDHDKAADAANAKARASKRPIFVKINGGNVRPVP